jgi:hypothetical protein
VQLRQPDSAVAVLTPLLEGPDAEKLTSSALLWRGRAELQRGAARAAVRDLERTSHDAAAFDLALAHVALGDVEAAAGVLMARVVRPYDEDRWLRTLDSVGVRSPESVAQVVDRLIARNDLTQGERGRLLLADGRRWSREGETGRGGERYRAAIVAAPDSVEGAAAQALLAIGELQRTTDLESLARISDTLSAARARGGVAAQLAGPAAGILGDAVRVLQDSQPALGDLKMFVIAEALRDSLAASVPARSMFLELQRRYPSSTVAAKALLAAALIVPSQADSVRAVLDRLYPASPYALALRGEAGSQFAATEDSLRVLLARARGLLGMPSAIEAIAEEEIRRR